MSLTDQQKANAPQTSQEAAEAGHTLRVEGRQIVDALNRYGVLLAKAERWLAEEEAIAAEVEPFEARKSNADERARAWGKHPFRAHASDIVWLVKACESADLDGLESERIETVADLRLVVALLKSAVAVAEKRLRLHDVNGRHQVSVTSWAKMEYGEVMGDRMDEAPQPPRAPHPASLRGVS